MAQSFNLKNIRTLLTQGFTDEELRRLYYDNSAFRPIYEQLAQGMGKDRVIDKLIEYAERKELMETLLVMAKELNPARYEKHQPYYDVTIEPTTSSDVHGKSQRPIEIKEHAKKPNKPQHVSERSKNPTRFEYLMLPFEIFSDELMKLSDYPFAFMPKILQLLPKSIPILAIIFVVISSFLFIVCPVLLCPPDCFSFSLSIGNLTGKDLTNSSFYDGCDFGGVFLREVNLSNSSLINCNLSGADFRGAKLIGSDLSGSSLTGANLEGASMVEAQLKNADFRGANLSKANLEGANLFGVRLSGANLEGANLSNAKYSKNTTWPVSFDPEKVGAILMPKLTRDDVEQILNKARKLAEKPNLSQADLSEADLNEVDLTEANLRGANLSGTNLSKADLSKADLSKADLSRANLEGAKIDNTTQIDDKWRLVWEIVTHGAKDRDLSRVNISRANLGNSNLSGTNLSRADLSGADLSGADLSGADLSGADLSGADLSNTTYSTLTTWPTNFDPTTTGAIKQ